MNVKVLNTSGEQAGTLKLNDTVFGVEYNEALVHQVVVAQLANLRQGTQSTLTRSEVRGHAKKPWRQKGTGRARHGSTKSPIWRGGGVAFAPKPRDFGKKINKSARIAAFKSVISTKLANKELLVLDTLSVENGKTKEVVEILNNLKLDKSVIFVDKQSNDLVLRAANNLYKVSVAPANLLSVYDIVSHNNVVLTVDAVKAIEEVYA